MGKFTGAEASANGGGSLSFAGGSLLNVHGFTISREKRSHETPTISGVEMQRNYGLGDSSGSFNAYHDDGANPIDAGTTGALTATTASGRSYAIKIAIQGFEVSYLADGMCEVTYRWEQAGDGESTDWVA